MPLGCPIQDGDNNDCREDAVGVKRGLKSLCQEILLNTRGVKGARQNIRVLQ